MSSSNSDQNQTQQTETWIQNSGLNPRTDWEIDWEQRIEAEGPIAVSFEPFDGLWPAYCMCYSVEQGYAILKIPPSSNDDNYKNPSNWLPGDEQHWCVVPEIFLRLQ